jgi:heterodisulfide reductase subunit B
MNVAYFPGCSAHSMAKEYDKSARMVCEDLGVHLEEVTDWNCCGATAAHSLNHNLMLGLNGRNLATVHRMGFDKVTTPCAGCFNKLKTAGFELKGSETLKRDIPHVMHLLQFLSEEVGLDRISASVVRPARGLKLAAYYGCLITRPRMIAEFDDPEQPSSMDRILQGIGAQTVKWSHKAECCGGGFSASQTSIVIDLAGQVLEAARQAGAEAVVVACPLCQANLDARQKTIEEERGTIYGLPIIYFTQLIALAFGHPARKAGLRRLIVSPLPLLEKTGLV